MADGALAVRFDATALAAFDLLILRRPGAEDDWDGARIEPARAYERTLDGAARDQLGRTIVAGLPGAEESYTLDRFRAVWAILMPLIILGRDRRRHLHPDGGRGGWQCLRHPDRRRGDAHPQDRRLPRLALESLVMRVPIMVLIGTSSVCSWSSCRRSGSTRSSSPS